MPEVTRRGFLLAATGALAAVSLAACAAAGPAQVSPASGGATSASSASASTAALKMYNKTASPDLAWEVLAGLTGKQFQTKELEDGTTAPPRLSVLKSSVFLNPSQPPAHAALFVDEVSKVRTDPQPNNWAEISTALNKQLSYLWTGERTALTVAKAAVGAVTPLLGKPSA